VLNGVNRANAVDVCDGGTLARTGTVNVLNAVTIHDGGTLAPGSAANPTDTLTIGGSLAFQSIQVMLNALRARSAGGEMQPPAGADGFAQARVLSAGEP